MTTKIRHATGSLPATTLFFLGEFKAAVDQALVDLEAHPDNAQARMVVVGSAIELGYLTVAQYHLNLVDTCQIPVHLGEQLPFFRYALAKGATHGNLERAVQQLDDYYATMGCRPVRMSQPDNHDVFGSLTCVEAAAGHCRDGYPPQYDGPLVSVVMTAYNVEHVVKTSVLSILNQSYRNLELIVVDDCSTDGTVEALRLLEGKDERMKVIAKDTNDGTYVSKNIGMLRATGELVAFQDSDDWSHPERLGKSVAALEAEPHVVALTTSYARMTSEGDLILQRNNQYSFKSYISLMFRKEEVLQRAGFFDSVRAEGDSEFERRLNILFGERRVVNYPWQLYFGRVRAGSITANAQYGQARGAAAPLRKKYRNAYLKWHTKISSGHSGFMPFPLHERPFNVPKGIAA